MKTVAILQNQWFKDPEAAKRLFEKHDRTKLIKRLLFAGCMAGRRLEEAGFPIDDIVWEEASTVIGSYSGSYAPADLDHLRSVFDWHQPDVVLAFGKIARKGVNGAWYGNVIFGPHPAARQTGVTKRLSAMAQLLAGMKGRIG